MSVFYLKTHTHNIIKNTGSYDFGIHTRLVIRTNCVCLVGRFGASNCNSIEKLQKNELMKDGLRTFLL